MVLGFGARVELAVGKDFLEGGAVYQVAYLATHAVSEHLTVSDNHNFGVRVTAQEPSREVDRPCFAFRMSWGH
jgi:hypothetical protein